MSNSISSAQTFPATAISQRPTPSWFPKDAELAEFFRRYSPIHRWVYPNYRIELLRSLARLWPQGAISALDIGAGDGVMGSAIRQFFPGVEVRGVDVQLRKHPQSLIPIELYDGSKLPFADGNFDVCIFSNVLHHVPGQGRAALVREASRVCRRRILIKDHLATGLISHWILGLMDFVGNAPFGAMVSAQYLTVAQWNQLFEQSELQARSFQDLKVQSGPRTILFSNRLEIAFIASKQGSEL